MSIKTHIDGANVTLYPCARARSHGFEGYVALVQCWDEVNGDAHFPDFATADDAGADHITKIMTKHVVWAMRVEGGNVHEIPDEKLIPLAHRFGFIV